jgi:hypothetical protein
LAAFNFLDAVVEAEAAIPSGVSIVLLYPRYYGVGSDVMVKQGGCVVQEYAQTFVCVCDRWNIVYPMLGLWMEADNSDFIPQHCSRGGYQFWSSIVCPRTYCLGLILSTTCLWQTTLEVWKAADQRWSRVELRCCGDVSFVPLAFTLVVSKEEDKC